MIRLFFCACALALAGCGAGDITGVYSPIGISNKITVRGMTYVDSLTIPAGTKLVITKNAAASAAIDLSLGGEELATAFPSRSMPGVYETAIRAERVTVADCTYNTSWEAGGTVSYDGTVLQMKRKGAVSSACTLTPQNNYSNAPGEQTLQATKDR